MVTVNAGNKNFLTPSPKQIKFVIKPLPMISSFALRHSA